MIMVLGAPVSSGFHFKMLRRGVTIIELLVSVAVLAVLMGIGVVAIGPVRESAGATKSMSNLRGIGVSLALYAQTSNGRMPFVEPGVPVNNAPTEESTGTLVAFEPVWWLDTLWPTTMHAVAPWPEHFETWLSPGNHRKPPYWPIPIGLTSRSVSYEYSNSFLGSPNIWSGFGNVTTDDIGPVRESDVEFPSAKVIMHDADRFYLSQRAVSFAPRPVLLSDSSAALRMDDDASLPIRNQLNTTRGTRRYHDTLMGVAGRDF